MSSQQADNYFKVYPIGTIQRQGDRTFVVLDEKYTPGLLGVENQKHLHILYWFDKNDTPEKRSIMQVHPRGSRDNPLTGVFGTHSPVRPNLIAISRCNVVSIKDNVIEIESIDAFDGSPVIDIKGDFFAYYKPDR